MIRDGGKGVGETNQKVEGREGRRMGWQWGGVQRGGQSAGMHGGSMWWEVVRQGGGAGKYAGMLNATRWHRRRQEDDCVEGWWVKEELVRSRLMRLMQADAAGSRAVHAHEGRGEGWRAGAWWMWLRVWLRGIVWWGEVTAAAIESWARGEGRRRRRPVMRWVSGRAGGGYRGWRKVMERGQKWGKDGERYMSAGKARERRRDRLSRGGTGDVEAGGRRQNGAGNGRDVRGVEAGWDWVGCDMVQEDVGAALTKPQVWVPAESPKVQAPYLYEEGRAGEGGIMAGGWEWLEVVVRGAADVEGNWGLLQGRGTVDEHHVEERRRWWGAGVGKCDDESRDAVCMGDDWGEWMYREAQKGGGMPKRIQESPAPTVANRERGGRRGGRRDWIWESGVREARKPKEVFGAWLKSRQPGCGGPTALRRSRCHRTWTERRRRPLLEAEGAAR